MSNELEGGHPHHEGKDSTPPGKLAEHLQGLFAGGGDHGGHGGHGGHEREGSRHTPPHRTEKRYQFPKNFYTNTQRGTTRELAYRYLAKAAPELEMSIDDETFNKYGEFLSDHVGVNMKRDEQFRLFVEKMNKDPLLNYIDSPIGLSVGELFEERGFLPQGMAQRIMKRYQEKIVNKGFSKPLFENELSAVSPASDAEIEEIVNRVVRHNYEDFKQQFK